MVVEAQALASYDLSQCFSAYEYINNNKSSTYL